MPKSLIHFNNSIVNTVDKNISQGVNKGVLHLTSANNDGKSSLVNNNLLLNFSSYSYLGLEQHTKLKEACIQTVQKYGTQFGFSRAFISLDLYNDLENILAQIFNAHIIAAPSTTLAHQAVLPVLVGDNDIIIIDQQAHASIHFSAKNVRYRGVKIELLRHNRVDLLENRIIELSKKYDKVWYLCDGVYSMYGDFAPLKSLEKLMNTYKKFYLYVDDAHGMSWAGINGKGYTLSEIDLHPQMIVVTSLNKAFAGAGGVIIVPHKEWKRKIRTCGGTLIFSTPIQPPMLGVDIASARLHLTSELTDLQSKLKENIEFCRKCIAEYNLPEISQNHSPIFYLPTSYPKISYNLVKRMMQEGVYLTPALFPAVSMKKSGIRFCISSKNTKKEIEFVISKLAHHYPKAISEEGVRIESVFKAFNILDNVPNLIEQRQLKKGNILRVELFYSITKIDRTIWNKLLGDNGSFDWDSLLMFENTFKNNAEKENNWSFYYFLIKDERNTIVLATFFTKCWCKDDVFKRADLSQEIELMRQTDKYYLCTESLMMGTLLTEGQHVYINKQSQLREKALLLVLDEVNKLQEKEQVNAVYLRDFDVNDEIISDLFLANGFVHVNLPDFTHVSTHLQWNKISEFLEPLGTKKRQQIKRDAIKLENNYIVQVKNNVTNEQLIKYYNLYLNVKNKSHIINTFTLPYVFFKNLNKHENWEMIILSLNENQCKTQDTKDAIAIVFAYKTENNYIPMLVGIDYDYLFSHKNYKQAVFQIVKRANELKKDKIYFGITATIEKKRVGAIAIPKSVFVQIKDGYNMDLLEMVSVEFVANQ